MQNQQASEIGSGGVVYCFHDSLLLLECVYVSISMRSVLSFLVEVYDVGKPHPLRGREAIHASRGRLDSFGIEESLLYPMSQQ